MGRKSIRGKASYAGASLEIEYQWDGINTGNQSPNDTLLDVYYPYIPGELQDEVIVHQFTVINGYIENVDSAQSDLDIGIMLARVNLDGSQVMVDDLDPLGSSLEDFQNKNILYRNRRNYRGSATTNNYFTIFQDVKVKTKRKLNGQQGLALLVRGSAANDWRYDLDVRSLFKVGSR